MNEEFNPYEQSEQQNAPVDPQQYEQPQYPQPYEQPQYSQQYQQPQYPQPYEQQYQQPYQQSQYQQYYEQPQYPQNGYYSNYPQQQYFQPRRGGGAAKVFAILSFVAGCISLVSVLTALTSLFVELQTTDVSYASTLDDIAISIFSSSFIISVPGIVFGIIALVRKTRLVPMAVLGIVFNAGYLIIIMIINMIINGVGTYVI